MAPVPAGSERRSPSGSVPHGLVVIGGSAGSIEVLRTLLAALPTDFAAPICIVIHVTPTHHSNLPALFKRRSALPVRIAADKVALQRGHVYIAPPDHHPTVNAGTLRVGRGPRENGFRPAIDTLFRSAAAAYGRSVVGVILSGALSDGVRGAHMIKQAGGRLIVQDPAEAQFPEMPRGVRALADRVVESAAMPSLLVTLVEEAMDETPWTEVPESRRLTEFTCPECGGVLSELADGITYRCHVGHAYSQDSLLAHGHEKIEAGLWRAIRIINEQAKLLRMLAEKMRAQGNSRSTARFAARAAEAEQSVALLRNVLLSSTVLDLSEDDLHLDEASDNPAEPA